MKPNGNYRPHRLPEKYKVPPNKKLEELKWNRNAAITAAVIVFILMELFVISGIPEDDPVGGMDDVIGATVFCFAPFFILAIVFGWFSMEEEIKPLKEYQRRKEEDMAKRIQDNKRTARNCEDRGRYDTAIEIWDDLGENSEVARVKKEQKRREEAKLEKERKEKVREAQDLERLFQKERKNADVEPDKYLDHALEIWKELGEGSEIERINELKVKYLYEKLKKKIEKLKNKGVDYTQLEEELATLEKTLDKPPE